MSNDEKIRNVVKNIIAMPVSKGREARSIEEGVKQFKELMNIDPEVYFSDPENVNRFWEYVKEKTGLFTPTPQPSEEQLQKGAEEYAKDKVKSVMTISPAARKIIHFETVISNAFIAGRTHGLQAEQGEAT